MNIKSNIDSTTMSSPETTAMFRRLRPLMTGVAARTDNQHDHAIALIAACIEEGIDEGKSIVGTLTALGFKPQHVGIILKGGMGDNAGSHLWRRDEAGKYSLHPERFQGDVAASHIMIEGSPVAG